MAKRWRIRPHDLERVAELNRAARVPAVVAQLLLARGIESADVARDFLEPKLSHLRDPSLLPGAVEAAQRIGTAIDAGQGIVIYGDYDVDGMTGTSILVQCLRLLGAEPTYYVPHRIDEGYGLNCEAIDTLAKRGARTIVTVDCGITSTAEAAHARKLGVDLIISDHHRPGPELPDAAAIVHPGLPGTAYPFAGLSGSGVALKLAWALCQRASQSKRVSERMRNFLMSAVGLAALGTVADVVPLIDENRVLVQYGLESMKAWPCLGLAALMHVAGLDQKAKLDGDDVGFALAPRLNAAGRFGQAALGIELLTTNNAERAKSLAEYIHELNSSRQSLERSIYLAANKQASEQHDLERDAALVLADHGWHAGVIGIVAGRLAEKYHRPVVMIALDELGVKLGLGSARSIEGFDLHDALALCSTHLASHGGHAAAAGLKIEESRVDSFRTEFLELAAQRITARDRAAELWIDAEVPFGMLTRETVEHIERLAPFGHSNHRPLFCATGVKVAAPPQRMGGGGRHLSLRLAQGSVELRGVAFGNGDWCDELAGISGQIDVAFRPVLNDFRGRRNVELHVADWRVSELTPVAG